MSVESASPSCLVIGCGYLGRRVLPLWKGRRIFAATRRAEGAAELASLGVEPVVCDVLRPESLAALPRVDTVLYAVGYDRASGASMRQVYVEGLANVLAHLPRPQRFLYVSSSSVYGQSDGCWVDETSLTEPQEESGRIVLEAERTLHAALPGAVILRFSGIYGPGRLLRRATIVKGDTIVGDADKWLNLIQVEDGARVILAAEAHATEGMVVNVCDDEPVRRRDFYTEMARVLSAPAPAFVAPPPGQPTPPHERGNRRIRNGRMKEALRAELWYPDYRQGLADAAAKG